jgi:3-hydroxyacyl-CoA dehydrogenase
MTTVSDEPVALVGAGTIGGGWVATYLVRGQRVLVVDPAERARARLMAFLDAVWRTVARTVPDAPDAVPYDLLEIVSTREIGAARLVHENGPESLPAKQDIYRDVEAVVGPQVPILSSSGGLMPSELQKTMKHPGRFLVAHPFSPVYALPLVEVLGGQATDASTVDQVVAHLLALGKHPVVLRKEVPGYLTNRLTFALLREAVHCLAEGVADAQGIEDAVTYGITPRYLLGGAITSLALAGGPGGMGAAMDSFAPAIESWWSDLGAPHLTPDVRALLVNAADAVLAGRTLDEVLIARDTAAVETMRLLRGEKPNAAH